MTESPRRTHAKEMQCDVLGIGVGPFNLSTAALLTKAPDVSATFLERNDEFSWHPGLLFPHATLQSPSVKDCVTLVDPTNEFSFLNYLARKRRLNQLIPRNRQLPTMQL